jgi:hypothetical protein
MTYLAKFAKRLAVGKSLIVFVIVKNLDSRSHFTLVSFANLISVISVNLL